MRSSIPKITYEIEVLKTLDELQKSSYHQQLGRKIYAAFVAQQQGIRVDSALRKVDEPMGDLWLLLAELARQGGLGETLTVHKKDTPEKDTPVIDRIM